MGNMLVTSKLDCFGDACARNEKLQILFSKAQAQLWHVEMLQRESDESYAERKGIMEIAPGDFLQAMKIMEFHLEQCKLLALYAKIEKEFPFVPASLGVEFLDIGHVVVSSSSLFSKQLNEQGDALCAFLETEKLLQQFSDQLLNAIKELHSVKLPNRGKKPSTKK